MKKNKIIIMLIIVLVICVIVFSLIYKYLSTHIFEKDIDTKEKLIQSIKDIEEDDIRKNIIINFVESNILTQHEANSLY